MNTPMMRKLWDFPGGIHPPENKHQSLVEPIARLPLPERLVLPLNQHRGAPARPVVAEGDRVLKGQLIAEPDAFISAAVHAPTSGTVTGILDHAIPHPSGMSAPCIVIVPDGEDRWCQHQGLEDYRQVAPGELLDLIREAGIAGLGGAGFPTQIKLGPRQPVATLIINASECEPYITADDALMRERAADIVAGIRILAHILEGPDETLIGIEDNKPEAAAALRAQLAGTDIELVEVPTKYPSGGEKQLIQILTGKEVPSGKLPIDVGVACQNVGTCYAIARAIDHGEPLISRITTVTGEACDHNRNYEVLLGTPVSHVLAASGFDASRCSRLVMGGPMMGFALPDPDVPVIKTTNCLLAGGKAEMPEPPPAQPCIRCGLCSEACPASLLPQQLFWYAQARDHERLEAHSLFDCIECGACAYVCPSHIPLVQYYRAAKGEITKLAREKEKSDRARQRYEFHKARLERAEAEKAAKREARRKAAEEAQQRKKTATDKPAEGGSADDIIQQAKAKAATRKASPEQQQAKLERGLEAARNRLQVAEHKLQEARDQDAGQEQLDTLAARVEEARRKLQNAEEKLQDFANSGGDRSAGAEGGGGSPADDSAKKLDDTIAAIERRIAKSQDKLATAEAEGSDHIDALNQGLKKLEAKLANARAERDALVTDTDREDSH